MCSRTRENGKNKVGTYLWDTLYLHDSLTQSSISRSDAQVVTLDTETMGVLGLGVCEDLLWFSPVVEMEVL